MQPNRKKRQWRDASLSTDLPIGGASGVCTAVIGSMTQAMGAQAVLAEAAIRANIVKISSSRVNSGCAYGLDFPCTQTGNLKAVLNRAGIRVREWI